MEGQADVDEGAHGLRGGFVLGVVEEVALAGLEGGMPFEDVEGGVVEEEWVFGGFFRVGVVILLLLVVVVVVLGSRWAMTGTPTTATCVAAGGGGTAHRRRCLVMSAVRVG